MTNRFMSQSILARLATRSVEARNRARGYAKLSELARCEATKAHYAALADLSDRYAKRATAAYGQAIGL